MDELKINNIDSQWKNYSELDDIFIEFYTENIDKFLSERTSQIDILEDLLRKYIENKKIKITPAGLVVTKGNSLEKNVRVYFDEHLFLFKKKLYLTGKFERYLSFFAKYVLPLVNSKKRINKFISFDSLDDQKNFYFTKFNNKGYQKLFKFFFSIFAILSLAISLYSFPDLAIDTSPVSSDTISVIQSETSLIPTPALCLVPKSLVKSLL